ncbi:MAG: methyltransferase domain-containing protein [bacterium]
MKRCSGHTCGTLWLDPAPTEESLYQLYAHYSTHEEEQSWNNGYNPRHPIFERIRKAYLHAKYGYKSDLTSFTDTLLGMFAYIHPAWRDTQAANIFYLPSDNGGTLLDVGCGSGSAMFTMQQKGWRVVGVDFDEVALAHAKRKGLEVYHGDLFSQKFRDESFDAILMNHVIEHIPSPTDLFRECRRILKKNGLMIILTPNACSRGHRYYGRNWRGLETPHHLHIFTPRSLATLGEKSGFERVKSFSSLQGTFYILNQSAALTKSTTISVYALPATKRGLHHRLIKEFYWFALGWLHVFSPGHDEVAVVMCVK